MKFLIARKIPGQVTWIISRSDGTITGGFSRCVSRSRNYDLMAEEIKAHDPFGRPSFGVRNTGQIPIWRVGQIIALGVDGKGGV